MDKVLSAVKQLLEASVQQSWSPLSDIKKVYYGDPITVALSDCPALIVRPKSTEYVPRGNQYDQKKYNVEVVLVYNQLSIIDWWAWHIYALPIQRSNII